MSKENKNIHVFYIDSYHTTIEEIVNDLYDICVEHKCDVATKFNDCNLKLYFNDTYIKEFNLKKEMIELYKDTKKRMSEALNNGKK